jgi:hypothetical protein
LNILTAKDAEHAQNAQRQRVFASGLREIQPLSALRARLFRSYKLAAPQLIPLLIA